MRTSTHFRRRGRRAGTLATFVALMAVLVASFGAAPAQAQQTKTAWIPLECTIQFGPNPQPHIGAALTATFPDTVSPGQQFALEDVTVTAVLPPDAQIVVGPGGDAVQGVVSEFWTQTTDATTAFATTGGGHAVNSSPTLFNVVGAVQPPNQPASVVEVNGGDTTRGGFQPATPAETFSFGDIPVDSTGVSGTASGPVPGHGGGYNNPSAGTAIALPDIGPITTTGAQGSNVVIRNVNGPGGNLAATTLSFHGFVSGVPVYGRQLTSNCVRDISPDAVPSPNPAFVDQFEIPIAVVGRTAARGTDPDAFLSGPSASDSVVAQFSAITNCDAAQSTRPFIVRWTADGTTYTFQKTSVNNSRCFSNGGFSVNTGSGEGTVNGVHATLQWTLRDGSQVPAPDDVDVVIQADFSGNLNGNLHIEAEPQPLSGTPGGVWVFGQLPWPAGP